MHRITASCAASISVPLIKGSNSDRLGYVAHRLSLVIFVVQQHFALLADKSLELLLPIWLCGQPAFLELLEAFALEFVQHYVSR